MSVLYAAGDRKVLGGLIKKQKVSMASEEVAGAWSREKLCGPFLELLKESYSESYGRPEVAQAVDDFLPDVEEEANALALMAGESILVWPEESTQWWWALKQNGQEGYVPGTLVLVSDERASSDEPVASEAMSEAEALRAAIVASLREARVPVVALPLTASTRNLPRAEIVEDVERPPPLPAFQILTRPPSAPPLEDEVTTPRRANTTLLQLRRGLRALLLKRKNHDDEREVAALRAQCASLEHDRERLQRALDDRHWHTPPSFRHHRTFPTTGERDRNKKTRLLKKQRALLPHHR